MNIPSRLPDNPASELQMFKNETPDTSWTWGVTRLSTGHLIARCDTMETAKLFSSAPDLLAQRNELREALQSFVEIEKSTEGKGLLDMSTVQLRDAYNQARAALAKGVA